MIKGQSYLDQIGVSMITSQQVKFMMKLYTSDTMTEFKYYYRICMMNASLNKEYKSKMFFFLFPGDHSPTLSEELSNLDLSYD